MRNRKLWIALSILVLMTTSLACGLFGRNEEPSDNATPANQVSESTAPDEEMSENAEDAEVSQAAPDVNLDEEYRSEAGGYAFQPISNYEMEEFFGLASMVALNADPDLGPMLMLIGGTNEEETTQDEIFDEFMQDAEGEDVEILDRREIIVDGKPGILADIAGDVDGQQVVGRIVVVAVNPTQQFTMFASAPKDRWPEIENNFNAVLASVHFFEPQEIDFSEGIDELNDQSESGEIGETPLPSFEDFSNFPSAYGDLPSGGFAYLLASTTGAFPVMVNQGDIHNQSTSAEYVIGLVSEDQQNSVTLFIPLDVASGVLVMTPYDENSATKGPGCAVYMGLNLFTNTDGIIIIEEMKGKTISGSFAFMAVGENGEELSVSGFFNALPLETP